MIWIRLVRHRHFTANLADSGMTLFHWHREGKSPECHTVGGVSTFTTLEALEETARAEHLAGHGPLQEDDSEIEPPVLN